jgi:hypothetical protein
MGPSGDVPQPAKQVVRPNQNAISAARQQVAAAMGQATTGVDRGYGVGSQMGAGGDIAAAPPANPNQNKNWTAADNWADPATFSGRTYDTAGVAGSPGNGNGVSSEDSGATGGNPGSGGSGATGGNPGSSGSNPGSSGSNPGSSGGSSPYGEWISGLGWVSYGGGGNSGDGGSGGYDTGSPTTEDLLNESLGGAPGAAGDGSGANGSGASGDGAGGPATGGSAPSAIVGRDPTAYQLPDLEAAGPNPERVEHVDTETLRNMLQQIVDAQKQQSENRVNYGVEQGVNDLNRAMEDAAKQYQTQRDQATADEMQALDNQALYAEARGDRGGIGEAQYASIQNTAAQNRRAVNDAQVKLGTDTARQISDLRSQGEFEKADQLLTLTQSYLSQLMNLEQWALGTNLSVDEFNSQLQQWVDEFNMQKQQYLSDLELSAAQLTGLFSDGTRTQAAQQQLISSLANSGNVLMQAGIMPSRQQLEAMGLTELQAKEYLKKQGFVV